MGKEKKSSRSRRKLKKPSNQILMSESGRIQIGMNVPGGMSPQAERLAQAWVEQCEQIGRAYKLANFTLWELIIEMVTRPIRWAIYFARTMLYRIGGRNAARGTGPVRPDQVRV